MSSVRTLPTIGAVVLSQGDRMPDLVRCLESILAQQDVDVDIVLVGNGWDPTGIPDGVRIHALPENLGIPGGRNVGAELVRGDYILFLDDDAWLPTPHLLADIAARFEQDPKRGSVQPHVSDPDGTTMRRWVPRARIGDPTKSGPGFTIAECVMVVRRTAFEQAGAWPAHFFYGHEGIDLTWRLWDTGWEVYYAGDLLAHHPATSPARHAVFYRNNARNRVWIARRNLPAPILAVYLLVWSLITAARLARRPAALRTWWIGFIDGWRTDPGPRRPMHWSTVAKLARYGQPPII